MSQKLLTGPGPCTEPGVCSRSDSLSPMMMMMMMKKKMEGNIPMSGKMAMPMTQNMANGKLLNFLNDRELVVKIAKKHRELSFSEHVQRQYDKLDPSSPSVMLETMMIWSDTANRVLKEMCPEFPDVKATPICLFAMEMLVQKYEKDPEVRRHLDFMYEFRSMMQSGKLQPGDKVPDVGIVDVETKEVRQLSSLNLRKNRPMVVIASSFS
ncbi:uncharacterized protein LOC100377115 [Saccoglossus kowalevskii]|uniref:Uncharacterized protein LOC100377115 n=1 Tax=Saccoglossus kowalevskii TaxID=10224 RepID=A0ABM0GMX4_SACKO|nr:PREDICTED: uncharacterized protein LOC100377115 [Saccoglossus kowalevskii]